MKYFKNISDFVANKQVFCGIDVHKNHWVVCLLCDGDVVEQIRIVADYLLLKHLLLQYKSARKIKCVYEAGFSGFWLCRQLRKDGYGCIVTPPSQLPRSASKVKTDKIDAKKLAFFLAANLLKSVWLPPEDIEADRRVVRRRSQLVKQQTRAKNQILSFLKLYGIKRPETIKNNWTQKHLAWLESLDFEHDSENFTFTQLLNSYKYMRQQTTDVTKYMRRLARSEKYAKSYKLLASAPGVGLITGMTFLLEIFDFGRFRTQEQFASYLGLTPSQYSSGENVRLGHITRFGNAHLRRVLIESAWTVIRHDPHLKAKYERLRARGTNGKKAIVAVARSFAIRLRRALLDDTGYVIGAC